MTLSRWTSRTRPAARHGCFRDPGSCRTHRRSEYVPAQRIHGFAVSQLAAKSFDPWSAVAIKDGALAPLLVLELHVLIGGPDRHWHQIDRVIGDARSDPDQHSRAPNWREHHAVDRELLNAVE